eukprot:2558493-Prymnesium_polylepis.1
MLHTMRMRMRWCVVALNTAAVASVISHQSSVISHQAPGTRHQAPVTRQQAAGIRHQSCHRLKDAWGSAHLGRIDVLQPQLQVAQPRARLRPLDAAVVPPHHARHLVVRAQPLRAAAGRP